LNSVLDRLAAISSLFSFLPSPFKKNSQPLFKIITKQLRSFSLTENSISFLLYITQTFYYYSQTTRFHWQMARYMK
jgi:hypothetical protein